MDKIGEQQQSFRRATLIVASITNFSNTFAASALNIAIPHIGTEYQASATSVSWIVIAFLLTAALLAIPFGRIADVYGRVPMLKYGMLLFCVTALLNMFSPNMAVFLLFRALQGVGAAMIFATNTAILVDAYPAEKRGSVMGIAVAAVFTGSACGPVIGGLLTHAFGWRSVFLLITAFALIALCTAMLRLPSEKVPSVREKAGIVAVIVRLFKNRMFTISNLAALFNFAAVFAVIYLMSIYLQLARGFTADHAGLIMITQPAIQAVLSPFAGRLSDKRQPAVIASAGMACCAGALVMFAFLGEQTSIVYIVAGLLLTGVGVALFSSPNSNIIMSSVENMDYGVAASVMSTSRMVGQVIGMALLTIIVNAVIGNIPISDVEPAILVLNLQVSFPIFAAICCVGILFSLNRKKSGGKS